MQFLLNRFNEKYSKQSYINVRFFDETPLTVRKIRYNQGGAVCYCAKGEEQGKQKVSNQWKPVKCSEDCKYRLSADGIAKPACNFEGTLKFLLPDISLDRIWIMKITGQTSIQRLEAYIELQKQLNNSLIGDFTLFLKQEEQTNRQGKTFNNYVLDIIKKEDFISNNSNSKIQTNSQKESTVKAQNVDNSQEISNQKENVSDIKKAKSINKSKKETKIKEESKKIESLDIQAKKQENTDTKNTEIKEQSSVLDNNLNIPNEFKDYYILVETKYITLTKDGKPTEYLVGNFVDQSDTPIDVIVPPEFSAELLECDTGTQAILDLVTNGKRTFTKSIKYTQKFKKNVAA